MSGVFFSPHWQICIIFVFYTSITILNSVADFVPSLCRFGLFETWWTAAHQASLSFSISRACSTSCPLRQWCHSTISPSVVPFSSCFQFFPASGPFPVSELFTSVGQSTGSSVSASVLPTNIQDWFPLGLTGLISLKSKELSTVFSNTTVQKHQFFGVSLLYDPTLTCIVIHDY